MARGLGGEGNGVGEEGEEDSKDNVTRQSFLVEVKYLKKNHFTSKTTKKNPTKNACYSKPTALRSSCE